MDADRKLRLVQESRYALHLLRHDGGQRLAGFCLALPIVHFLGQSRYILPLIALLVLNEAVVRAVLHSHPVDKEDFGKRNITLVWSALAIAMIMISIPGFVIAQAGSIAALMSGLLWLVGISTYVSYSFGKMPFFRASIGSIQVAMTVIHVLWFSQYSYTAASGYEWFLLLGQSAFFFLGILEAMKRQNEILIALDQARKEADARLVELEHLNSHDSLTKLKTRRAFDDLVEVMLQSASRSEHDVIYVFLLDLDGFKPINDSYSHAAGDKLLCVLGQRMKQYIGRQGVVARLGGDEFAVAVQGRLSDAEALDMAEKMIEVCTRPTDFDGRQLSVGVSIGISSSRPGDTIPKLLSRADQAMYAAKALDGSQARVFDPVHSPPRASLEDKTVLLTAMNDGQILPYYQPKVDLQTGEIRGFEALARWEHPEQGLLLPGKFLPSIDELGLQGQFLQHTLECAMQDITRLVQSGLDAGEVSVNLPESTLATNSGRDAVLDQMRRHPLALPYLTFEVTENIFISRSSDIIQRSIEQFRRMGVRVSLDDFGTGFASFQNLRELEFDELKLDTAIVSGLSEDPSADVLVKAFLDIGHGLDVSVVAEGIETELQLQSLRRMGCTVGQGFLFGRAVPFDQIMSMLQSGGPLLPKAAA